MRWISPGIYELDVQNTSGIGYINVFTWTPPPALTVVAVTKTVGGKCSLAGGYIQCSGKIPPPKCTCQAGGDLTVTFTAKGLEPTFANGYWTYYGIVGALSPDSPDDSGPVPHSVCAAAVLRRTGLQEGSDEHQGEAVRLTGRRRRRPSH